MHDSNGTVDFPVAGGPPPLTTRVMRALLVAGILAAEGVILLALGFQGPLSAGLILGGIFFVVLALATPAVAWLAIVAAVPFSIEILLPGVGAAFQAPTEPMILMLVPLWGIGLMQGAARKWPPRNFVIALLGITIVPYLTCVYTAKPAETFKVASNLVMYAAFGIFLGCSALKNVRDLKKFAAAFAIPAALASIYYLFNLSRTSLYIHDVNAAGRPIFNEHGTFAAYLCFAFPMAVICVLWSERRGGRLWYGLTAGLIFAGIVFSLTRAAWLGFLGMAGVVTIYFLSHSRNARAWGAGALVGVALVAALIAAAPESPIAVHVLSIADTKSNVSNLERFNRWMAAIDMFVDRPLGGVGYGAYKYNFGDYQRIGLSTTESGPGAGAHSLYLSILAETGLAGAAVNIAFAVTLFLLVKATLKRASRMGEHGRRLEQMTLALGAGVVAFAIHGIFNYYHSTDKVNVPFWTFVGALVVCAELTRAPERGSADAGEGSESSGRHAS